MNPSPVPSSPLDLIRRKEAEVKRHLVAESQAAEQIVADAERRARALVAAAEAEGRQEGEAQRQAARAEAERRSVEIVAQARSAAASLQIKAEKVVDALAARAVKFILEGQL